MELDSFLCPTPLPLIVKTRIKGTAGRGGVRWGATLLGGAVVFFESELSPKRGIIVDFVVGGNHLYWVTGPVKSTNRTKEPNQNSSKQYGQNAKAVLSFITREK